jgi:uncharacterized membrane protein YgaE (UPF0421/DUF939 family)
MGRARCQPAVAEKEPRLTAERLLHAVKIGIAGVVALYVAELLKLPQPYWAAISAFVVMGASVRATVQASSGRLIGTAIGAVVGAVFVVLWGSHLWSFGLAATLTALGCAALRLDQSYRLACVTVAIVMLIHSAESAWKVGLHRFLEVALGIVVALLISALPPNPVAHENRPGEPIL